MRTPIINRFYLDYPWIDVMANDEIILKRATHPLTLRSLAASVESQQDTLLIERSWLAGWQAFLAEYPQYADNHANRWTAFRALPPGALPTPAEFENVAHMLGESAEYREQLVEQRERAELIAVISQGKDSYTWRDITGKKTKWATAGLEEESTQRLQEIAASLKEQRRLESYSPEEIRSAIKQAQAVQGSQEAKDALLNPTTGQPYTRREIVNMIAKGDKKALRGILFDHDGRVIPERQKAIDNILKGQQ